MVHQDQDYDHRHASDGIRFLYDDTQGPLYPYAILGGVWLFHILYFIFGVKKYKPREEPEIAEAKEENETEQSQNSDCHI